MDDSLEFHIDMQKFLLKKEKEYGQLKFILSRATEETSLFIDELLEAVANIAKKFNMYNIKLFYEDDATKPYEIPKTYICEYNCFVMNTNFSSQYLLAEDLVHGYMANLWPTLSPYLFIQMIWHIKCEDLLIESLMYLPLDICTEILEITVRCINELETLQNRRFIFLLISKLYYKCMWLHLGVLSKHDVAELACQLVTYFQTLLDLVSSKFIISTSTKQEKYVQHGILLKYILRCIKTCMRYKTKNLEETDELLKSFTITYGNPTGSMDYFCKLSSEKVQSIVTTLDQELVTLLQDQIKQVDCFEFMEWAEVDDEENIMISLQRAVIIECHCFMEFVNRDEFLSTKEDLVLCLQQLVGSSKSEESILSLKELCDSIMDGKLDEEFGMKELIKHYKKWDFSVLNFITTKIKLKEEDLGILLEYLHYIFGLTLINEEKHRMYMVVLKVLTQKDLSTMYNVILQYTLRHFYNNHLVSLFNSEHFNKFIESNINVYDQQKLRVILLIFIMLNPRKVLTTLVRITIGSTDTKYRNIMFNRSQLAYLDSFFTWKLDDRNNLLIYLLNDAWLHDHSTWYYKQFEASMDDMLETKAITPDNLLNNVYIPFLTSDDFNWSNLLSVLTHMYSVIKKNLLTHKTNYVLLIEQLTKKMSMIRKCNPKYLRNTVNNLLDCGKRILIHLFIKQHPTLNKIEIIKVNNILEPIDQILLTPLEKLLLSRGTIQDVILNYERRCFATYELLRAIPQYKSKMHDYVHSFQLDRKALLRHIVLHASEEEYRTLMIEITLVFWAYFGWANKPMAYENIVHITTEAMQLALVFTDIFPKDSFVSLLRALMHYCETFSRLEQEDLDRETIYNMACFLSRALFSLKNIVNETQYGEIYDNFLKRINNIYDESNFDIVYFYSIKELVEECFVQSEEIESETSDKLINGNASHSASTASEIVNMLKAYQFVCRCIDNTL